MSAQGGVYKGCVSEAILPYLIYRPRYHEQNFNSTLKSGVYFRRIIYMSDSQSTQSVKSIEESEKAPSGAKKIPNAWSEVGGGELSSNSVCLGAPCRTGPYQLVRPLLRQGLLVRISTGQNPDGRSEIVLSSWRLERGAANSPNLPLATSMIPSKKVDLSQRANYVNAGMLAVPSSLGNYALMVDLIWI